MLDFINLTTCDIECIFELNKMNSSTNESFYKMIENRIINRTNGNYCSRLSKRFISRLTCNYIIKNIISEVCDSNEAYNKCNTRYCVLKSRILRGFKKYCLEKAKTIDNYTDDIRYNRRLEMKRKFMQKNEGDISF